MKSPSVGGTHLFEQQFELGALNRAKGTSLLSSRYTRTVVYTRQGSPLARAATDLRNWTRCSQVGQ